MTKDTGKNRHIWEEILAWPATGESLVFDEMQGAFSTSSGKRLPFQAGIVSGIPQEIIIGDTKAAHYIEHYKRDAKEFDYFEEYLDPMTRFEQRRLHEHILSHIPDTAKTIVDVGCGNAWVAAHFIPKEKVVISTDIGKTNLEKALEKYPSERHLGLLADAFHLPLKTNSVDVVIAAEIMEHVYDPKAFMTSLSRIVKPGGIIIITTPYHEKLEYSLCIHCNQPTPRHAHLFSFHEKNIGTFLPADMSSSVVVFMNKFLLKSRLYKVFKALPHQVWFWADQWFEKWLPGALRFMIVLKKPEI